jgi:prolyl oligopeptidase
MNRPQHFASLKFTVCLLLLSVFSPSVLAQNKPPVAPVKEVTDDYFGTKIVDPYRWMEDLKSKETFDWIKAQADYADAYLQKLSMRGEILKRLDEAASASVAVGGIRQRGNLFFYTRRAPGENDTKIYVRENINGTERLLVDPEKMSVADKRYSLGEWNASHDGKYVSYIVSVGGSENGELRVVETASGKDSGERIDRTRFVAGEWLPDGKSFIYNRMQKLPQGAPPTDFYQKSRLYLHVLGTNPDADKPVFGFDYNAGTKFDQSLIPFVQTDANSKYVLASTNSGVSPNSEIYAAPVEAINQTDIPWRRVVGFDDEVFTWDTRGDDLYLVTYKNTPRFKVVYKNLAKPGSDKPDKSETIFPASEAVAERVLAQPDALYVQTLDGGNRRIWRVDYKTRQAEALKLPYEGSSALRLTESGIDGIYFNIVSWTKSNAHFRYDPKTRTVTPTNLIPPSPVDMSSIEFTRALAKSHDGAMIPLVVIYKKGLKRDGKNPALLSGYGAYGAEWISPVFNPSTLAWLERGGVLVFAGVRGGGEYGEDWHEAGMKETKPNTWKDFIACAEYLVAEKYTSPQHLGVEGISAGGVLISNTITERPDLFGAAVISVGLNNILRFETTANGIPNIPEFGSAKTVEGFKSLLAMDGYSKIKKGVKYPAVLLAHGFNDPRVDAWMSAKMAARLQAATTSGKPVLLRVDYDAGHVIGTTVKQRNAEQADIYAFLFEQLKN